VAHKRHASCPCARPAQFWRYMLWQRLTLVEEIRDSIAADGTAVPLPRGQAQELERGLAAHELSLACSRRFGVHARHRYANIEFSGNVPQRRRPPAELGR
jgi:hypothetical protein